MDGKDYKNKSLENFNNVSVISRRHNSVQVGLYKHLSRVCHRFP